MPHRGPGRPTGAGVGAADRQPGCPVVGMNTCEGPDHPSGLLSVQQALERSDTWGLLDIGLR
jgi:hypothetical protein